MNAPVRMVLLVTGGSDPTQTEVAIEWNASDPAELPGELVYQAAREVRRRRAPQEERDAREQQAIADAVEGIVP